MNDKTPLRLAIIGNPLSHTISPALHGFLLRELNIDGRYEIYEIDEQAVAATLREFQERGMRGFNVTVPFKQKIMGSLNEIDELAATIGAVNTVLIKDGQLSGFNTDCDGFRRALARKGIRLRDRSAVVLGAGGAARAIVFGLVQEGVRSISICNRTRGRAEELVRDVRETTGFENITAYGIHEGDVLARLTQDSLLVNATSVGTWPQTWAVPFPIPHEIPGLTVVDLVYNPLETRFLKSAIDQGAEVVDGLDMLIYQGLAALEIWLQKSVEIEYRAIRTFLIKELERHGTH